MLTHNSPSWDAREIQSYFIERKHYAPHSYRSSNQLLRKYHYQATRSLPHFSWKKPFLPYTLRYCSACMSFMFVFFCWKDFFCHMWTSFFIYNFIFVYYYDLLISIDIIMPEHTFFWLRCFILRSLFPPTQPLSAQYRCLNNLTICFTH